MKVDLYKRPEGKGAYSYLAVPQGQPIPNEATNVDWETAENNVDLDDNNRPAGSRLGDDALQQINAKGYAISSVQDSQVQSSRNH